EIITKVGTAVPAVRKITKRTNSMAKQQAPEERQVIARGVSPGYSDKRTKPRPNARRSMKYI
ncbi:MAG: hypothetical protein ACKVG9_13150, partial [Rhodospirillales bacterium]